MTRREYILNATAAERTAFGDCENDLCAVRAEMGEIKNPTVRLVRLSDRAWDLEARLAYRAKALEAATIAAAEQANGLGL